MGDEVVKRREMCPSCGAPVSGGDVALSRIQWNEEKRQFDVHMVMVCPLCASPMSGDIVTSIPVIIASNSRCSCGATMTVADYSIATVGRDCEFRGTFVCVACKNPKKTTLQVLFEKISSFWRQTKSIEIGVEGVKYEKATPSEKHD